MGAPLDSPPLTQPDAPGPLPVLPLPPGLSYPMPPDDNLLDREMTARLCRTFGWCLLIAGVLTFVPAASLSSGPLSGPGGRLSAVSLVCLVSSCVMLCCVRPIRQRKHRAAVAVLVVGLGLMMLLGWVLVNLVRSTISPGSPTTVGTFVGQWIVYVMLLVGGVTFLFHVIRLIARPGFVSAAKPVAALDVGDVRAVLRPVDKLANAAPHLRRLGVVRMVTGATVAAVAGALLWMSVARVPASAPKVAAPGAPAGRTLPFAGDLYDAKYGLPAAERALIVDHVTSGVRMTDGERMMLDDALRYVGAPVIDEAGWSRLGPRGPAPPPPGPAPRPLTKAEVARRLPDLSSQAPPFSGARGGIVLNRGGWQLIWSNGLSSFTIEPDRWVGSPARMGPWVFQMRGDVAYPQVASPEVRFSGQWSLGAVERFLFELRDQGGAPATRPTGWTPGWPALTVAQAEAIVRAAEIDVPGRRNVVTYRLPFTGVMRADGVLDLTGPSGRVWVERHGVIEIRSPEARAAKAAAAAANVQRPARLRGSLPAATIMLLAAIVSIVLAAWLFLRGAMDAGRTRRALAQLMVASAVGLTAAARFVLHVLLNDPLGEHMAQSRALVFPILLAVAVTALSGFWMPFEARRRLAGPA